MKSAALVLGTTILGWRNFWVYKKLLPVSICSYEGVGRLTVFLGYTEATYSVQRQGTSQIDESDNTQEECAVDVSVKRVTSQRCYFLLVAGICA